MSAWRKDETLNLIWEIRNSNVWNAKAKDYKNLNKKNDILTEIAGKFCYSKKEREDKWHNTKTQFSREESKILVSLKSGCGSDDVYTPSWYTFEHLKFLKDQYTPHQNRSTDEKIIEPLNANDEQQLTDNPALNENDKDQEVLCEEDDIFQTSESNNKKRKNGSEGGMESVIQSMKIVGESLAQRQRKDEFDVFGEHIANELRQLKEKQYRLILAEAKQKINSVLSQAEIKKIKIDTPSYLHSILSSSLFENAGTPSPPLLITNYSTCEPSSTNFSDHSISVDIGPNAKNSEATNLTTYPSTETFETPNH